MSDYDSFLGGNIICFVLSYLVMIVNIFLVGIPVYKECKNKIRWYQTPFLFVLFFTGEGMVFTCFLMVATKEALKSESYAFLGVAGIGLIFAILIIFSDQQATIAIKCGVCFAFLAVLTLLFTFPLHTFTGFFYLIYISMFIYSIGPVECLVGSLINNQYDIIPIVNVFMVTLYNILRSISFIGYNLLFIINIIGMVSCVGQIIVYFLFRAKRNLQNTIEPGLLITAPYQQQMVA